MDRKALVTIVIILSIWGFRLFFFKSPKEITIDGNNVTIKYGKHYIGAHQQSESTASFLVNNAFYNENMAGFFVIPLERAEALKRQYGDFVHCNSPGAEAGKQSLCTVFLLPLNTATEQKIKGVMKYKMDLPVIKITGNKLDIREHKFEGIEYGSSAPGGESYYLISDIGITQEHYR